MSVGTNVRTPKFIRARIYFSYCQKRDAFILFIIPGLPPIPASKSTSVSPDLTTARLKRQPDIQMDRGRTFIISMTLVTPDTLLVSNRSKSCVQLFDSGKGGVLSQVQLQDNAGTLCLTDRNTAAVSAGKKIQMIQVKDNTLTLGTVLTVSDSILGITSSRNCLVVSYSQPPWLEVVSMDGQVQHQFDMKGKSNHIFSPSYICTAPGGSVFISDGGRNTITQVDAQLNLLQTFTSPLLHYPCGITAVTEDQILVCSWGNKSILLLQPSTNTVSTLLGKDDGIELPRSLAYCTNQKKLFVTGGDTGIIQVFQIE